MNDYQYKTIDQEGTYELQEKFIVERNGQRIVVSYRIKNGEEVSKTYFSRRNAIKAFVKAYIYQKLVK